MTADLTIGKLAEAAGVNIETIRYYQRRGLLEEPAKPLGGHRRYAVAMVSQLRFIRRAQALGFTLEEIGGLLRLSMADACADTHAMAVHKVALIEQKMRELTAMHDALAALVTRCEPGRQDGCPIIESLAGADACPPAQAAMINRTA